MMRRLWIVLAVVFASTSLATAGMGAVSSTGSSKSKSGYKMTGKQKATASSWAKSHKRSSLAAGKARGPMVKKHFVKKSFAARSARGPMYKKHYAKRSIRFARHGVRYRCYPVRKHIRRAARPATVARGPVCPAPVVNVPQQAAPVVNVPQQPAPVVNVPAFPPTVGVTVDNCNIYVVQNDQLMIIDKNTYCLKQSVPLTGITPASGSSTGTGGTTMPSGTTSSY